MATRFTLPVGLIAICLLAPTGGTPIVLDPNAIRDFDATDFLSLTIPVRIANLTTSSTRQVMPDLSTGPVAGFGVDALGAGAFLRRRPRG